jgi:hypothetical protein
MLVLATSPSEFYLPVVALVSGVALLALGLDAVIRPHGRRSRRAGVVLVVIAVVGMLVVGQLPAINSRLLQSACFATIKRVLDVEAFLLLFWLVLSPAICVWFQKERRVSGGVLAIIVGAIAIPAVLILGRAHQVVVAETTATLPSGSKIVGVWQNQNMIMASIVSGDDRYALELGGLGGQSVHGVKRVAEGGDPVPQPIDWQEIAGEASHPRHPELIVSKSLVSLLTTVSHTHWKKISCLSLLFPSYISEHPFVPTHFAISGDFILVAYPRSVVLYDRQYDVSIELCGVGMEDAAIPSDAPAGAAP